MKLLKKWKKVAGGLVAAGLLSGGLAQAAYPEKPVSVVVGFAPGGTNDIVARFISSELEKRLGQPFVVVNKPGASSMISANFVKQAEPDGYTLLVIASGGLTVNPAVYKPGRVTYDPIADFTPIAQLSTYPLVLVTGRKLDDVNSIEEVIARGRESDMPLTHGVATSAFELAAEVFGGATGIEFTQVPYKGSGPVVTDLMGGQIDLAFLDTAAVVPGIESGRLRAQAVTSKNRSSLLPDVPTVAESGIEDFDVVLWAALMAPAGVPDEVVTTLSGALREILADPQTRERFARMGMEPGVADPQELAKIIESDLALWTKVAKEAGIEIE